MQPKFALEFSPWCRVLGNSPRKTSSPQRGQRKRRLFEQEVLNQFRHVHTFFQLDFKLVRDVDSISITAPYLPKADLLTFWLLAMLVQFSHGSKRLTFYFQVLWASEALLGLLSPYFGEIRLKSGHPPAGGAWSQGAAATGFGWGRWEFLLRVGGVTLWGGEGGCFVGGSLE